MRGPRTPAPVALLPTLATFVVATQNAGTPSSVMIIIDLTALVALLALLGGRPEVGAAGPLRIAAALGGATVFGAVPSTLEYVAMARLSDANWDVPPGTGYPLAAVLIVAGVLTMILTLVPERRPTAVVTPEHLTTVP